MLSWVYEAARACPQLDEVLIATDSEEVHSLCQRNGWPCLMTSADLPSGSDRVHAAAQLHPATIYVNLQADEPLLRPEHISSLLTPFTRPEVQVTTLKVLCTPENLRNPNAVKVVTALDGRALYFSRATLPFVRDENQNRALDGTPVYKHIGLYAYRAQALNLFHSLPPSPLEQTERLEQLRFLENGIPLHVYETPYDTLGVDTPEDLARVQTMLKTRNP